LDNVYFWLSGVFNVSIGRILKRLNDSSGENVWATSPANCYLRPPPGRRTDVPIERIRQRLLKLNLLEN